MQEHTTNLRHAISLLSGDKGAITRLHRAARPPLVDTSMLQPAAFDNEARGGDNAERSDDEDDESVESEEDELDEDDELDEGDSI